MPAISALSLLPCLLERSRLEDPLPVHHHIHHHLLLKAGLPQGFCRQRRPVRSRQSEQDAACHCNSSTASLPGSKILWQKWIERAAWTTSLDFWAQPWFSALNRIYSWSVWIWDHVFVFDWNSAWTERLGAWLGSYLPSCWKFFVPGSFEWMCSPTTEGHVETDVVNCLS